PNADVRDINQRTGIGLYRVARIDVGESVLAPNQLPIRAARTHLAADAGALDGAPEDVDDAAGAVRQFADDQRIRNLGAYLEREFQLRRLHRFLSVSCDRRQQSQRADREGGEVYSHARFLASIGSPTIVTDPGYAVLLAREADRRNQKGTQAGGLREPCVVISRASRASR